MPILESKNCVSCGVGLTSKGSAQFPCPHCGETISRCGSCREQAVHYTCHSCKFQGP